MKQIENNMIINTFLNNHNENSHFIFSVFFIVSLNKNLPFFSFKTTKVILRQYVLVSDQDDCFLVLLHWNTLQEIMTSNPVTLYRTVLILSIYTKSQAISHNSHSSV